MIVQRLAMGSIRGAVFIALIIFMGYLSLVSGSNTTSVSAQTGSYSYQMLADSTQSQNYSRHVALRDYALFRSQVEWPLRTDGCGPSGSTAFKTVPWQPYTASSNSQVNGFYDGNTFNQSSNCASGYTDAGSSIGAWAKPNAFDLWASEDVPEQPTSAWVSPVSGASVKLNGCSALPAGAAQSLWDPRGFDDSDHANGANGLFARNNGGVPPGAALYSHGTTFFRNKFTISQTQYDLMMQGDSNVFLYAIADDWFQVYVNGMRVGATNSTIGSQNMSANVLKSVLRVGENTIAIQAADKAVWGTALNRGVGMCYQLAVQYDGSVVVEPADFTPTVTGAPDVATIGQNIQFQFTIRNNSSFAAEADYQTAITTTANPSYSQSNGTTPSIPGGGTFSLPTFNVVASEDMGGRICASLLIVGGTGYSQDCVVIGRKPLFQVWGGDVWAGGSFASGPSNSCSIDPTSPGNITGVGSSRGGSWGEYGVFAAGRITSFGSAAQPQFTGQPASKLTFANTNPSALGFYYGEPTPANGRCLTDMFSHFGGGGSPLGSSTIILNSLSSGTYTTGDVTVRAPGPISGRIIIVSSGTITIDSSPSTKGVRYRNNNTNTIDELPQIVLLAEKIVINSDVENVDAWLGARNTIITCETAAPLDDSKCNKPLTINGPVTAGEIILNRTSGAGNTTGNQPAEKFNLRPDSFLRSYADKSAGSQIRTLYQQELPPRY